MRCDSIRFTTLPQLATHLLKARRPVVARKLNSNWRCPSKVLVTSGTCLGLITGTRLHLPAPVAIVATDVNWLLLYEWAERLLELDSMCVKLEPVPFLTWSQRIL